MEKAQEAIREAHRRLCAALEGLDPEDRRRSLEDVREHQAIAHAYRATHPVRESARLARADAPTGRALRDEELVDITWVLSTPEDETIEDRIERRRHRLVRLASQAQQQGAAPTVADLAEALGVSASTIKRDLAALRNEGRDIPTRGSPR
jgi:biotin operon repressor